MKRNNSQLSIELKYEAHPSHIESNEKLKTVSCSITQKAHTLRITYTHRTTYIMWKQIGLLWKWKELNWNAHAPNIPTSHVFFSCVWLGDDASGIERDDDAKPKYVPIHAHRMKKVYGCLNMQFKCISSVFYLAIKASHNQVNLYGIIQAIFLNLAQ